MTKLHRLFFVVFLLVGFTSLIMAQNGATNKTNGKIPMLHQNPSVPWVHTPPASIQAGDMAYGWESISGNTISMPIPAGTPFTTLGTWAPPNFGSSATRGGDGNYYFVDAGPPPGLYQFDPGTGAVTLLGTINGIESGGSVNGICYDPVNDTYYMAGGVFTATNNLYSFDLGTMTATLVGSFPSPTGAMIDIAINSSGVGYGYDLIDDNAYTFDPVSGATTLLGPLGYDANYGQGMDINQLDGTIYLSSFNNGTFTGQLRTMDPNTGATALVTDWGFAQVAPFAINNDYGPPVGPGPATNPDPANGATNVALNAQLSWTNPAGATSIDVYFGTDPGAMTSIYSGTPVTTVDPGALSSLTTYYWRVDETDGTGTTTGSTWHFTTMQVLPPNVYIDDHFDTDINNWTIVGPLGMTNWLWSNSNNAGGNPGEMEFSWSPSFVGDSWIMNNNLITGQAGATMHVMFKQYINWFTDPFDLLFGVTTDGGATWTTLWDLPSSGGSVGPETVDTSFTGVDNMQFGFAFSGNSFNINWWYLDDVFLEAIPIPVELTSFTANVNQGNVTLNWSTATETNNKGFQIQRKSANGQYQDVAFVNGNGTSTQVHTYSYTDSKLTNGVYTYRIKQVDFDGTFKYSNEVTANVNVPATYSLKQNYPNPFNPTTKIDFTLATDSKVTVKVFDLLGREVATLLNSNLASGQHSIIFNATNLNSGVYFYRLQAQGTNGKAFTSIKKMILMK